MAPLMHRLALGASAVAIALSLHGCGGAVSSFADAVCRTTIEAVVNTAENDYQTMVENKCKELRDHAHEQALNANKSDELYHKCITTAGAHVLQDVVAQKENYTTQCLEFINAGGNASAASWSQLTSGAHSFMQEHNFQQDLDSLLDSAVLADVQKLADDLKGGGEGGDANSGDAKSDEKGSDEKGSDEKGSDEKGSGDDEGGDAKGDEKGSGEKGSDEEGSEEKGSEEKSGDEKAETEKSETKEDIGDDDDDDEVKGSKDAKSRLFDASIHLGVTYRTATGCVMLGAIATAVGLAVMVRRRVASRDFFHEGLVNAEDSEFAHA